ncbi:MAG TPA: Uma2 family endonuclease [Thermoanaerobaculia bacterium]
MIAERPIVSELPGAEGGARRRFTSAEYHTMAEAGILAEDERVELIAGEIVRMAPIGSRHAGGVKRLNRRLTRDLGERALISIQDPIAIGDNSEPQPDVAVLRPRPDDYTHSHPKPADVLLVIEVADSSLAYDRGVKIPLYAVAGILEVWLVCLDERRVEIHREPAPAGYRNIRILHPGDRVSPLAFPDFELTVDAILG